MTQTAQPTIPAIVIHGAAYAPAPALASRSRFLV
jgi:hypothetical protein